MREKLASRLGFILLSAGCAIGIGNVWRFPYVCGQSGGGAFVAIYLFFLAILGIPVLIMEFAAGRAAQRSITVLHRELQPERKWWSLHGIAGLAGNVLLMMFYTTVTGWMVIYFCKTALGDFAGLDPAQVGAAFGSMLGDWKLQTAAMLFVALGSAAICAVGVQKGLERVTKGMMLMLLLLIVVLAVNSVRLPGAGKGVGFLLVPDLDRFLQVGVGTTLVNAMNQAFFTLSLGIGAMAIFGSYIGKSHTLLGEAVNVAALDTVVAMSAGLIILPACFAYGIEAGQGPGLLFVTLPNVFNHMPLGRLWGALFFLFMCFAALSTVLAVFECIIAGIVDYLELYSGLRAEKRRAVACLIVAIAIPLLSMPCLLGFNLWSGFQPFGEGSCVLDFEDFLVSDLLLPLGSLAFAVFCCHRYGWGWEKFRSEANAGRGPKLAKWLRPYCAYVLPLIILAIFVIGLYRRFIA